MTLVQKLFKKGIIDKEKTTSLEYEVKTSGKREEEVILERKIVPEEILFNLKSESLKIPLVKVSPEEVSLKTLELIPEDSAKYYKMIPLAKEDNVLKVGMVYPEDLRAQEALKFLARQSNFSYRVFLITISDFENLLKRYRTLAREVARALEELETELKTEEAVPTRRILFERLVEKAPITKIVAVLLRHATEGGASDIHIEPTREKLKIRFRLLGILHPSIFLPMDIHPAIVARIKILANLKLDETRIPQDGRFSTKIAGRSIDFRVSTFPTAWGEKVAIRILDPEAGIKSLAQLGLTGRNLATVKNALQKSTGLILATGPTGCGKTTTLYAMLQMLNKEAVNIMTLEDPIEYFIEGINQSQIRPEIGYDYATGLRHLLRQDPDVIMVGEIRDEESAVLAIHAALTGHLVFSTLHTADALAVIPRLIHMKIQPYLISPTLSLAIAQRLVRTLCPDCKKKIKPKKEIKDLILKEVNSLPEIYKKEVRISSSFTIYTPGGCKKCNHRGYIDRTGIFEVLSMTDKLAEIILKEPTESKIAEEGKRQGRISMKQDGILKVLKGITTIEEVLRVAEE